MFRKKHRKAKLWKGFVLGLSGGVAGVMAMDTFQKRISPLLFSQESDEAASEEGGGESGNESRMNQQPLDSIAVTGVHHKQGESPTAALGRILYRWTTGQAPESKEAKSTLSNLIHWAYGILQGGVYGAGSTMTKGSDLRDGLVFGAGLWLFGDELAVPMLGLQEGPTASSFSTHANRLVMHLVYGAVTAITTGMLRRLV